MTEVLWPSCAILESLEQATFVVSSSYVKNASQNMISSIFSWSVCPILQDKPIVCVSVRLSMGKSACAYTSRGQASRATLCSIVREREREKELLALVLLYSLRRRRCPACLFFLEISERGFLSSGSALARYILQFFNSAQAWPAQINAPPEEEKESYQFCRSGLRVVCRRRRRRGSGVVLSLSLCARRF